MSQDTYCFLDGTALRETLRERDKELAATKQKLEPLRREVAMLRDKLSKNHQWHMDYDDVDMYEGSELRTQNISALEHTQATAEAYEREVAAKALDNATYRIEQRAGENSFYANHAPTFKDAVDDLKLFSAELRAANKGKEIV